MINCIIYEDNEKMRKLYKDTVKLFFKSKKQDINFYIYNCYHSNLEKEIRNIDGDKLFILDVEVPGKSGLDLARIIRKNGDWSSPLIVVTSYDYLKNTGFTSKMLMLDFISKKEDVKKRLIESLNIANNIINTEESYNFQYNGKLYHVYYQDILFFEKDLNDNYTFLYTKTDIYKLKESITQIENNLQYDNRFYKTHRSCIININNVNYLDLKNNILVFDKYTTDLLTKDGKDGLKKLLSSEQIRN